MDTTKKTYFINLSCNDITAKNKIYSKFDYELDDSIYDKVDDFGLPSVYNSFYEYLKQINNKIIVTLSPDPAISGSTVAANAEKHMMINQYDKYNECNSSLKILYFTSRANISTIQEDINIESLSKSLINNLICDCKQTYTKHNMQLSPDQFILIGLNDKKIDDNDMEYLNNNNILHFSLSNLRKKGIVNIISSINDVISNDPVHVVFDMSVMNDDTAPCVTRFLKKSEMVKKNDGLSLKELQDVMKSLNNKNIVGVDITGYDFRISDVERMHKVTCETGKMVLQGLLNISEKKLNIFNENSKFLIWRSIEQEGDGDEKNIDVGWHILRNVPLDFREQIISQLDDGEGDYIITTISLEIENESCDVYITVTTMEEQNSKSYYSSESVMDLCLFPDEKIDMGFELLNTDMN
jgi:hypothetical protein